MKKNIILGLATAGFLINAANVHATSNDNQYPAANFQPKVVFVDESIANDAKPMAPDKRKVVFDPKYPAADFQPQVIYIDKDSVAGSTVTASKKRAVIFDPKYPAAYYEPKVIYP